MLSLFRRLLPHCRNRIAVRQPAQSHLCLSAEKQFANIGCFGAALKLGVALVGCLRGGRWRVRGGRWRVRGGRWRVWAENGAD